MPLIILFVVVIIVSLGLTSGVDYMHENHPDYNGDDLFGEE
jgi:hypothetical protein